MRPRSAPHRALLASRLSCGTFPPALLPSRPLTPVSLYMSLPQGGPLVLGSPLCPMELSCLPAVLFVLLLSLGFDGHMSPTVPA